MIREMRSTDVMELLGRVRDAANESGWISRLEFDPEHIVKALSAMIASDDYLVIGTDDCGAMLIARVSNNWYSPSLEANELVFYVHPELRCTGLAKQMITQYLDWAKSKGVLRIRIGVNLGICPDVACALCESLGFKRVGYSFMQEIEE